MAATLVVALAVVSGKMQRKPVDMMAMRISVQNRPRPDGQAIANLYVFHLVEARRQRLVKLIRLAKRGTVIQPHARLNQLRRRCRCHMSRHIGRLPQFHWYPPHGKQLD